MNILMVAYYFPPDSSSGAFRPLHFATRFQQKGDRVHILTAREENFLPDQPLDPGLVPGEMDIVRTRVFRPREGVLELRDMIAGKMFRKNQEGHDAPAQVSNRAKHHENSSNKIDAFQRLKDFITTFLALPDPHAGWFLLAVKQGIRLAESRHIDVIYTTGSPWTSFLIGVCLKWFTGLPLVSDFRDPWTQNPKFLEKEKFFRVIESLLEGLVVAQSDLVVANTKELAVDFAMRFPRFKEKVTTITNGYEQVHVKTSRRNQRFTLTHAGSLYFSRNPLNLLRAVLNLVDNGILSRQNFLLNFIGGIDIKDSELLRVLEDPRLSGILCITPRVSFQAACDYQQRSDVLFLIQTGFPLQVPRKLYETMAFGKPVLGITSRGGATATMIKKENIGLVVENSVSEIQTALLSLFRQWESNELDEQFKGNYEAYGNDVLCAELRHHLSMLCRKTGR